MIALLSVISGKLIILGLSPNNYYHLFNLIDDANLDECIHYFFNPDERCKVENILPKLTASGKLKFIRVRSFGGICIGKKQIYKNVKNANYGLYIDM